MCLLKRGSKERALARRRRSTTALFLIGFSALA